MVVMEDFEFCAVCLATMISDQHPELYLFEPKTSSCLCSPDVKTLVIKGKGPTHMTVGIMAMGEFEKMLNIHLSSKTFASLLLHFCVFVCRLQALRYNYVSTRTTFFN